MRARQTKTASTRLEGFIDWKSVVNSEAPEEEEMSSLAVGFATQMRKRATVLEGETTSSSCGKRARQSPPNEGAQKNWAIVSVESPDLTSNDQLALGDLLNEAGMSLEEGVPVGSSPSVEEVGEDAPAGVVTASVPLPKLASTGPSKKRLPNRVLVSTYVPSLERVHPSTGMVAPDLESMLKIVRL